jgi:ABC-type transport system substrate-binding protein
VRRRHIFDSLTFPIIPDDIAKQSIALEGGQLDYSPNALSQADWDTVRNDSRFANVLITAQDFNYMRINQGIKPMEDVRVRQALSAGIDRRATVDTAFQGVAAVPTGPLPSSRSPWGQDPQDVPYHSYDPQNAKQLLSAAGSLTASTS